MNYFIRFLLKLGKVAQCARPGTGKLLSRDAIAKETDIDRQQIFFHGTDLATAIDISKNGIRLDKSQQKLDFSDGIGFYLNSNGDEALEWARSKQKSIESKQSAVLVYRLTGGIVLDLRNDQEQWSKVVLYHRKGKKDSKMEDDLNKYDYIIGPMVRPKIGGENMDLTDEQIWKHKIKESEQVCIRKEKFASSPQSCHLFAIARSDEGKHVTIILEKDFAKLHKRQFQYIGKH